MRKLPRYGLILLAALSLAGCGYRLGPPEPSPPLQCCHTSGGA
jgi:hypothetical protein